MKTITETIYTFDELTEKAQEAAWMNSEMDFSGDYSGEYRATLDAFETLLDIRVYDYSVGNGVYYPHFRYVKAGRANEAPEGGALRLARYVWNNFAADIMRGKYYSKVKFENGRYISKHRYSRILREMDNCPLTGVCTDCDILQPMIDCLHYRRTFETIDELIDACLQAFFRAWNAEIEHCNSLEYFADAAAANDWHFYENGVFYGGIDK